MKKILILLTLVAMAAAPAWAAEPWMIAVIPDTQNYVDFTMEHTAPWYSQMNWIIANRDAKNIQFVTHEGDVIDAAGDADDDLLEWSRARDIMAILDDDPHPNGVLPYSVTMGNHDLPGCAGDGFVADYGPSRYETYDWYGGHSPSGKDHYQYFSAGGRTFLHLNMSYGEDMDLDWAVSVLNANSNVPTILTIHAYLRPKNNGEEPVKGYTIWKTLIQKHPQVFMTFNGHFAGGWKGQAQLVSTNDAGKAVYQMCSNMQKHWGVASGAPEVWGGSFFHTLRADGWFRTVEFIEGGGEGGLDRIQMKTLSPWMIEHPEYASYYDDFDPVGIYTNGYYEDHPETDFYFDLDFDARLGPAKK